MKATIALVLLLSSAALAARPDQVLVLFNKDWTGDLAGTDKGQDSEEVARHYVAAHTDPAGGAKPYVLGLSCVHRKADGTGLLHLNGETVPEASGDNFLGVVYKGKGRALGPGDRDKVYRPSNLIECPIDPSRYDMASVTLKIGPAPQEDRATTVYSNGQSARADAVLVTQAGEQGRRYESSAARLGVTAGPLYLWVTLKDAAGGMLADQMLTYPDYRNIVIPVRGPAQMDWATLEAFVFDPRRQDRRVPICRNGKSLMGPALRVEPPDGQKPGQLVLNAEQVGWRGDFMIAWSGKDRPIYSVRSPEPGSGQTMVLDGRRIHLDIPQSPRRVDWNSLAIRFATTPDASAAKPLYADGACKVQTDVVDAAPVAQGKTLRLSAYQLGLRGDVYAFLSARNAQGKDVKETARFFDPDDMLFSRTGADGVRDDLHYLEDIEGPVKAFLENPANAADGKPLKDRILYIVVCWGLPRTVQRTYGLWQTAHAGQGFSDAGSLASLEQRMEMMYYDVEKVRPPALGPFAFRQGDVFTSIVVATTYILPFMGWHDQPYLHPAAYDTTKAPTLLKADQKPPHFTPELRASVGADRFLYLVSRIDGLSPQETKGLVDQARYASRHLTLSIGGRPPAGAWDAAKALQALRAARSAPEAIAGLGLGGRGGLVGPYETQYGWEAQGRYLPGSVDWTVISSNGFNNTRSGVRLMLAAGVTATGGAARSEEGCAHTTTHGWWDGRIFFQALFDGYDLGEAWMYSKFKCQWVTSMLGDPLFHPDLSQTTYDTTAPRLAGPQDVSVRLEPAPPTAPPRAIVSAQLLLAPGEVEVAVLSAEYWEKGNPGSTVKATSAAYSSRPQAVLDKLKPATDYECRVTLTNPYLNTLDAGVRSFRTK